MSLHGITKGSLTLDDIGGEDITKIRLRERRHQACRTRGCALGRRGARSRTSHGRDGVLVRAPQECRNGHFLVLVAPQRLVIFDYTPRQDSAGGYAEGNPEKAASSSRSIFPMAPRDAMKLAVAPECKSHK